MGDSNKKYFEADNVETLSDEILEFSRKYRESDFPNPKREGCLPNKRLLEIANSTKLPDAEFREHLLNCSPCFNNFQTARQAKTIIAKAEILAEAQKPALFDLFLRPFPIAVSIVLIGGLIGIFWLGWFDQTKKEKAEQDRPTVLGNPKDKSDDNLNKNTEISTLQTNDIDETPVKPDRSEESVNQRKKEKVEVFKKPEKPEPKKEVLVAKNTINLDLAKAAVLRNGNSKEIVYGLPSKIVIINVKLPPNYPTGNYEVSLLDEFGKPLLKGKIQKSKGKNIVIHLDLQNIDGLARLCVAPKGEIPDCFAVNIRKNP